MKKLLTVLIIVTACSGENDDPQPSRAELLASAPKWELISTDNQPATFKLNIQFKSDGSLVYDRFEFGYSNGQWVLSQNDQVLTMTFTSGDVIKCSIIKLTATELIYTDDQGVEYLFHPL